MQAEFLFSGFGGQGVMFAGQLLSYIAMDNGYHTTWIPSYGPEMRGGTAHCYTLVSKESIGSPIVEKPKVVVAFNSPSFDKYENTVDKGGVLVYDSTLIEKDENRTDIGYFGLHATEIADFRGNVKMANMALLGAAISIWSLFDFDTIAEGLELHIPERHRHMLRANLKVLESGFNFCKV